MNEKQFTYENHAYLTFMNNPLVHKIVEGADISWDFGHPMR